MRQGDGSDVLGPGDPRNSDIGILYVEAKDSRQAILTALNTQEVQGRKQIAIVLPEQGKAFRHPLDFDGLKNIRRQLKAQLIFIVPSGRGPAELARQRRFAVYSSLDTFKTALLNEGMPTENPRAKAQPGSTKRPGILDFGGRKASANKRRVPITPKLMQPAPPTPRLHDQPTPLIMPQIPPTPYMQGPSSQEQTGTPDMPPMSPTPRVLNQPGTQGQGWSHQSGAGLPRRASLGNVPPTPPLSGQLAQPGTPAVPPTPHLPRQWDMPTPRINEIYTAGAAPTGNAPDISSTSQSTSRAEAFLADERMAAAAAGMLAASSLESDDDALYAPPSPQQAGSVTQGHPTPDGPVNAPAPDEPSLENRPTPRIIAFPEEPATPKATDTNRAASGTTNSPASGKMTAAPENPASAETTPGSTNSAGNEAPGTGANPGHTDRFAASGTPISNINAGNTGQFAASGTAGSSPNSGNTGQFATFGATGMTGTSGAMRGTAPGPGSPAQPIQRGALFASSPAANQPGSQAPTAQWGASRFGSNSMSPRPSGLTPLPPPYSRRARRRRNRTLLLLFLLFLLCALTVVGVFARHSQLPGLSGSLSATVTLTPASKLETDNYLLSALPTGTPDPAHLQIAARLLTQNSGASTATANATGSVAARAATGTLVFFNSTSSGITLGSTTLVGADGVQIRFNGPVLVPASGSASTSAPGYALNSGSKGNIPAFDIGGPCCATGISVKNTSPFSGGQDAQQNSVIQQSDLDNAARPLISKLTQSTGTALQKQMRGGERVVENTFQCKPTITSDHKVGDVAKTASAHVITTCTEEVYDYMAAQQIAISRLQSRASDDPSLGSHYALDGAIITNILSDTVVSGSGQATIEMQAQGLWVYQFTSQMQQSIKQSLLKLSQADAQNALTHRMGVAAATITLSGNSSLPADTNAIMLVIQQLPRPQSRPNSASGGSGSPTVIPSGTGIPAGPALTPTLTPVPGLG